MSLTAEKVNSLADIVARLRDAAIVTIGGKPTMLDAKGRYVPVGLVSRPIS